VKQITTTVERIKQAGYWCSDADAETASLLAQLGVDRNTEIPVRSILNILGLAVGLLSLGAVHPRYKLHADAILKRYNTMLFRHIGTALANLGEEHRLTREALIAIGGHNRDALRRERRAYWWKYKTHAPLPMQRSIGEAIYIMLSVHPLHIKLVHAGKAFLDAAPPLTLTHLTAELGKMLDEPL
jgi:hypothetical protein